MKPQENKMIALRKAISSHEEAEATLLDLVAACEEGNQFEGLLERIRQNLRELHLESEVSRPEDRV